MPFDSAGTEKEPRTDLGIGEAVAGEASDVGLLRGEVCAGFVDPPARAVSRCEQLAACALGEGFRADRRELLVGDAELLAPVDASALAAQPFAVEQMGAGEVDADPSAVEPFDRFAIETFRGISLAHQGARTCFDAERPVRPAR